MHDADPASPSRPAHPIASVDRALRLLLLLHERGELRVRDVADELEIAPSTAHRILSTLVGRGFVVQDRGGRSYRAGGVFVEIALGSIKELDVRRKARVHMERLARQLHETVNLIALEGDGCRFIDGVEGDQLVHVSARTGTLLPAYATSGGKVLLAQLPSETLERLYPDGLRKLTVNATQDLQELEAELAIVRNRGYALNVEESEIGLWAVAVAVCDRSGRAVAALAVSRPFSHLEPREIAIRVQALRDCAKTIQCELL